MSASSEDILRALARHFRDLAERLDTVFSDTDRILSDGEGAFVTRRFLISVFRFSDHADALAGNRARDVTAAARTGPGGTVTLTVPGEPAPFTASLAAVTAGTGLAAGQVNGARIALTVVRDHDGSEHPAWFHPPGPGIPDKPARGPAAAGAFHRRLRDRIARPGQDRGKIAGESSPGHSGRSSGRSTGAPFAAEQQRFQVSLFGSSLDSMADIRLPDGRTVSIGPEGEVLVSRASPSEWPAEGNAYLWLPDPELSSSDHQGYHWDVVKTRRRSMSAEEAARAQDRWRPAPARKATAKTKTRGRHRATGELEA